MDDERGFTGNAWHVEYTPYYKVGGCGRGGWLNGNVYWDRDEADGAFTFPDRETVRTVLANERRDSAPIGYVVLSLVEDTYEEGRQTNAEVIERVRYPVGVRSTANGDKRVVVFWSKAVEI